jgi:hypothetical protein
MFLNTIKLFAALSPVQLDARMIVREEEERKVAYFKQTLTVLTFVRIKGRHMENSFSTEAHRSENCS